MEKQYLLQFKNSSKHYDKFSSFDNINKAIESFCLLAFYDSNNITFKYTSTGEVFLLNNNNITPFGFLKFENNIYTVYFISTYGYTELENSFNKQLSISEVEKQTKDEDVKELLIELVAKNKIEVGYRQACGSGKHNTQKLYDKFDKSILKLQNKGYLISKESVKHKNAYATNNGGFWNSYIYRLLL